MVGIAELARGRAWTVVARIVAVLAIGVLAFIGAQRDQEGNQHFDVFDEGAHFDYVLRLSEGQIPKWGTQLSQETMLIETCLGDTYSTAADDCTVKNRDPNGFAAGGFSYEAQQPPLGYVPYLPGMYLSTGLSPAATLDLVRDLGGSVLLLLACALLFVIATKLRMGFWRTLLLSGITLLAPISIHAFSTVTNDGSTLVAALLFVAAWLVTGRWSRRGALIAGVVTGAVLGATKSYTVLLPAALVVALVLITLLTDRFARPAWRSLWHRPDLRYALGSLAGSVVVAIGFLIVQSVRATTPASHVLHSLLGFAPPVSNVQARTVISSIANLTNNWLGPSDGLVRTSLPLFFVINAVYLILIGAVLVRGWRRRSHPGPTLLVVTWAATVLAFSITWPVLLIVQGHFNFDAPSRYGLMLLPLGAIAVTWGFARTIERLPEPGLEPEPEPEPAARATADRPSAPA